jgi:hypothetical protein
MQWMKTSATTVSPTTQQDRKDTSLEDQLDVGEMSNTHLGRLAIAARREYFAAGGRVLTDEELEREIAERRGGTHLLETQ